MARNVAAWPARVAGIFGVVNRVGAVVLVLCVALLAAVPAAADEWWPHPANAQWNYTWRDSTYNPAGTQEAVTVGSENDSSGCGWNLSWQATGSQTVTGSGTVTATPDSGTMCFQSEDFGIVNTDWTSSSPPANEPILCPWTVDPNTGDACANSLSSALFQVIWGIRSPVLSEPLLDGTSWTATGGAYQDVTSANQFLGLQIVKVPAFPGGVTAAVVRSSVSTQGDLGDPYGSGIRTTWWVYGVGPVQVVFHHNGGTNAPVTEAYLDSTNLLPLPPPPVQNYFPLSQGLTNTYRWTNPKHLPAPEIEKVTIAAVANRSARFDVQSVKGPVRTVGQYGFTVRNDGIVDDGASAQAASLVKFPKLGHSRHFFTPIDLMEYGFDPILPAYPEIGSSWSSQRGSQDFQVFGVTGQSTVLGVQKVKVPAGTFQALEIRTVLKQPGHRFGSGVRWSWFAPGRGLVKLIFDHADHSVSTVVLLK
jgi:hypothetical protein